MVQLAVCIFFLIHVSVTADAKGFLHGSPSGGTMMTDGIRLDLQQAIESAGAAPERQLEIHKALLSMFQTLPKNSHGRIERSILRYALHRYFVQQYGVTVLGLEPTQNILNTSALLASSDIFRDRVPVLVEAILEGKYAHHGFGIDDVVAVAVVLEELMLVSESTALEGVLAQRHQSVSAMSRPEFDGMLAEFMLRWVGGNETVAEALDGGYSRAEIEETLPNFDLITEFARGEADRLEHKHRSNGGNPFVQQYSYSNLHEVVSSVTKGFGRWWETECQAIKSNLTAEDTAGVGRVKLADFYHRSMGGEWRFGESEKYLRDLGALDDSSRLAGPQVIIPNYLQGVSNCIVTSTYYNLCCVSECETLLREVEGAIQAPVGVPEDILSVVMNMTDVPLPVTLSEQLHRVAQTHSGKVPLHGRLFAQWLHFAFPQECPFPHRSGTVWLRTPTEVGDDHLATEEEIKEHAKQKGRNATQPATSIIPSVVKEPWMSQWMDEEELLADYVELNGPWKRLQAAGILGSVELITGAFVFCILALMVHSRFFDQETVGLGLSSTTSPLDAKPHSV